MANSVDPDQTAPSVVWSGSAVFAYAIMSNTLVYEILGNLPYTYHQIVKWVCWKIYDRHDNGIALGKVLFSPVKYW